MVPIRTIFNRAKDTYNDYEFDDIIIISDPFIAYHTYRKLNDLPEGSITKRGIKVLIIILLKIERSD